MHTGAMRPRLQDHNSPLSSHHRSPSHHHSQNNPSLITMMTWTTVQCHQRVEVQPGNNNQSPAPSPIMIMVPTSPQEVWSKWANPQPSSQFFQLLIRPTLPGAVCHIPAEPMPQLPSHNNNKTNTIHFPHNHSSTINRIPILANTHHPNQFNKAMKRRMRIWKWTLSMKTYNLILLWKNKQFFFY